MLRQAIALLALFAAAYLAGCTTSQSGEMDAGPEPDAEIPDASLPEATGFFQVAEVGERWLFITPDGAPFYSVGVNHVTNNNNTDNDTGICPYCEAVEANYESEEEWAEATTARLESWGFNTISGWSREDLFSPLMPWTEILNVRNEPDVWAPEWEERLRRIVEEKVLPYKDDPNLVGWFLDNELKWGKDWRSLETMLDVYMALEEGSPGREMAKQYGEDHEGFLTALATRYFQKASEIIREADPNHLLLGSRPSSLSMPPQVPAAATPYMDVFSVNFYATTEGLFDALNDNWGPLVPIDGWLQDYYELSELPLMATEFSFRSEESDPPNSYPPIYLTFPTQEERAAAYDEYVQKCFDAPYFVGHHWFEYVDQPVGGRGDGEDNNFGLVTVEDEPYEDFVEPVTVTNSMAPHLPQ
jgi:agarase